MSSRAAQSSFFSFFSSSVALPRLLRHASHVAQSSSFFFCASFSLVFQLHLFSFLEFLYIRTCIWRAESPLVCRGVGLRILSCPSRVRGDGRLRANRTSQRSVFGLIRVYNELHQDTIDCTEIKVFQRQLQNQLKSSCAANGEHWERALCPRQYAFRRFR